MNVPRWIDTRLLAFENSMPIVTKKIVSNMFERVHKSLWHRQGLATTWRVAIGTGDDSNKSNCIRENICSLRISAMLKSLVDAIRHSKHEIFAIVPDYN